MNVLIDTCVVLDYLQAREPFFDDALNLFIAIANNEIKGYISANSVTDLHYIINRHYHNSNKSKRILSKLFRLCPILDTTSEDCIRATESKMNDFEDAVMAETALRSGMDRIITRNIDDFNNSPVHANTPGDFLVMLDNK